MPFCPSGSLWFFREFHLFLYSKPGRCDGSSALPVTTISVEQVLTFPLILSTFAVCT